MIYRINKRVTATVLNTSEMPDHLRLFPFVVSLETEPSETRLGRGNSATVRKMPGSTAVVAAFEQEIDAKLYIERVLKGKPEQEQQ